jgi:hypothetical protein
MIETKFYFGAGEDKNGKLIKAWTRERALKIIQKVAAKEFGAWTLVKSVGGWQEVVEQGFVLTVVYTNDANIPNKVARLADAIKAALKQQSVFVTSGMVAGIEY